MKESMQSRSNEPIYHQAINNNLKANYIVNSTLQAIRTDIENMQEDIQTDIKQEKNALSHADQSEDNA